MGYKLEQNKNMKLTLPYYLHKAGAGFPSPATDYIEEDIDLNMHLLKNVPATIIIRVQGKSMVDVGINDGDLAKVIKCNCSICKRKGAIMSMVKNEKTNLSLRSC